MSTPTALQRTFEARRNAQEELRGLYDSAADLSALTADEQASEARLGAAISDLQAREQSLIDMAARDAKADEARSLSPVPAPAPKVEAKPSVYAELRSLARGERGSVQIGYEARDNVDLVTGTATDGAELVETTLLGEIHNLMVENSPIMQVARVLRTAGGAGLVLPRVTSHSAAILVAEAAAFVDDAPQFGTVTLNAYKFGFTVQISRELEQDSAFNVAGFVVESGAAALGRGVDAEFVSGSGTNRPSGVDNATVGKTTAAVGAVTLDELIDLQHSVIAPQRSRGVFMFNDATIQAVRKLKDSTGNYIWQASAQAGAPDTLFGRPVYADPNLATMATGAVFGVFGDMNGFYVRIAGGVQIDRSSEVGFLNDLVTYRFLVRVDSEIVDTTGIRTIKNA